MAALVTVEQMKTQLRIRGDNFDSELATWIDTAHGRIARYIKATDEQIGEMDDLDKDAIRVAEILAVKGLFEGADDAPMTGAVLTVLHDFRSPSLA